MKKTRNVESKFLTTGRIRAISSPTTVNETQLGGANSVFTLVGMRQMQTCRSTCSTLAGSVRPPARRVFGGTGLVIIYQINRPIVDFSCQKSRLPEKKPASFPLLSAIIIHWEGYTVHPRRL